MRKSMEHRPYQEPRGPELPGAVKERVVAKRSAKLEHTLQGHRDERDAANASEGRLLDLVATINDWIWEMNVEGVYTYASPRVRDLLGYEPEEMVGKRFFDFMPQEEATVLAAFHEELVASRMPIKPREATLIHRDGHLVNIEVSGVPFFAPDGSLMGYRGVDRDISERKQVEKALRESADQLQAIYDGIADGLVVAEVDTGRIVRVSPPACAMFGYSEREFLEKRFPDLHPAASLETVEAAFRAQAEDEQVMAPGLPCARKDGSIFLADITSRPIIYAGRRSLVGIFRDITERTDAEARLRQYARRLKRANEEVKQFAYIVSHDLRGPLINLRGFTSELRLACATLDSHLIVTLPHLDEVRQREATAALRQDIPQALEFIEASVTRMDSLINAVLKLSRLGRCELSFEKMDLSEVVQGALKTLSHQIGEGRVRVTVGPLPEVIGDRTAMEQMVGNILTNAVNYLEPGRPGEIEVGGGQQGSETTFFVRDNGRGIAESDMRKVFALFRRAGRQDVKGEGMGLAYVQTLAHRHGGYIRCESELGVGTTLTVVLSNHPEEEGAGNAPTADD
jgi:PAS domain S-box-containing protein